MSVLDLDKHLRLVTTAHASAAYLTAHRTASRWDPDIPDHGDVTGVTRWAVESARDGWLLGCWYRALTAPWTAVVGTDPMEAFK